MNRPDVIIVGAGLAGLAAGIALQEKGVSFLIVDSADAVGGRVRTDEVEGFRLDRGFQVYLTAYPEGQRLLDYAALDLRPFENGAMIRVAGEFLTVQDPWRGGKALSMLFSPVGSLSDKLKLKRLRQRLLSAEVESILAADNHTTAGLLKLEGFSQRIIDRFFRPFLGGIMLDSALQPSSRFFEFVFKMMSEGDTVVPARGMGEIPAQLAQKLPANSIRLNAPVEAVSPQGVRLASGEELSSQAVILATDGLTAARLAPEITVQRWRSAACVYFDAPEPPVSGAWLTLNGNLQWPVSSMVVMSEVSREYAPEGRSLISVGVLGRTTQPDESIVMAIRSQLERWFGKSVRAWRHLRTYRIPQAQPDVVPAPLEERPARLASGVYVAGDHRVMPSIHFALLSGTQAAEAVASELSGAGTATPTSPSSAQV